MPSIMSLRIDYTEFDMLLRKSNPPETWSSTSIFITTSNTYTQCKTMHLHTIPRRLCLSHAWPYMSNSRLVYIHLPNISSISNYNSACKDYALHLPLSHTPPLNEVPPIFLSNSTHSFRPQSSKISRTPPATLLVSGEI